MATQLPISANIIISDAINNEYPEVIRPIADVTQWQDKFLAKGIKPEVSIIKNFDADTFTENNNALNVVLLLEGDQQNGFVLSGNRLFSPTNYNFYVDGKVKDLKLMNTLVVVVKKHEIENFDVFHQLKSQAVKWLYEAVKGFGKKESVRKKPYGKKKITEKPYFDSKPRVGKGIYL